MGRILEPGLQSLVEFWSAPVKAALEQIAGQRWPPYRQKQGFLKKPRLIPRFTFEGPIQRGGQILWAVSHTTIPSTFDRRGNLTQGEREYWIVGLEAGEPPHFWIEGAGVINNIPAEQDALQQALAEVLAAGPKHNMFYGNRGPLSHR